MYHTIFYTWFRFEHLAELLNHLPIISFWLLPLYPLHLARVRSCFVWFQRAPRLLRCTLRLSRWLGWRRLLSGLFKFLVCCLGINTMGPMLDLKKVLFFFCMFFVHSWGHPSPTHVSPGTGIVSVSSASLVSHYWGWKIKGDVSWHGPPDAWKTWKLKSGVVIASL